MKKIKSLIIGTGAIGAYLSKLLIEKKHSVVVTSRLKRKNYRNYENLKISKKVVIKRTIFFKIDFILNSSNYL